MISRFDTSFADVQLLELPTSMYSIKRMAKAVGAAELDERQNIVVVDAALDHRVQLDRRQPGRLGGENPFEHLVRNRRAWSCV